MNAIKMIADCGRWQVGDTPPISTARGNEGADTPMAMSASDTGLDGHVGQRDASEDRRDDGSAV